MANCSEMSRFLRSRRSSQITAINQMGAKRACTRTYGINGASHGRAKPQKCAATTASPNVMSNACFCQDFANFWHMCVQCPRLYSHRWRHCGSRLQVFAFVFLFFKVCMNLHPRRLLNKAIMKTVAGGRLPNYALGCRP